MATTPVNVAGLDGGSKAVTLRGDQNPDNSIAMRASLEIGGAAVGAGNAVPVLPAGNVGTDRSANAPAGPGAETSFTFNGAALSLLATIAANPARKSVQINNTTGQVVVLVIDDGSNGSVSLFPLIAGAGQFQQGGDFTSATERGQIRIFGTVDTFCYAREN